jgi:hypothetical protein
MPWLGVRLFVGTCVLAACGCGGKTADDSAQSAGTGGFAGSGSNSGGAAHGITAGSSSTSNGGSTPNGGLEPLSPDVFGQIQLNVCGTISEPNPECTFPRPQLHYGCGSLRDATDADLNVVVTLNNGTLALLDFTSPDCPVGNGYFLDTSSNLFVLCPATCAMNQRLTEPILVYATCSIAAPCIN